MESEADMLLKALLATMTTHLAEAARSIRHRFSASGVRGEGRAEEEGQARPSTVGDP